MNSHDDNEAKYEALGSALRKAEERRRTFVPPTLDEAILKQARAHFGGSERREPRGSFWWSWILGASLAAIALCFVLLRPNAEKPRAFAKEDINHDGQVDILDAMTLAKTGTASASEVEALALAAVRLDRKPGS